jgi:hypothetical protein
VALNYQGLGAISKCHFETSDKRLIPNSEVRRQRLPPLGSRPRLTDVEQSIIPDPLGVVHVLVDQTRPARLLLPPTRDRVTTLASDCLQLQLKTSAIVAREKLCRALWKFPDILGQLRRGRFGISPGTSFAGSRHDTDYCSSLRHRLEGRKEKMKIAPRTSP